MSMRRGPAAPALVDTAAGKFVFDKFALPDAATDSTLQWKDLSETEKSAASLGVDPTSLKPIKFLNDAHYENLLKTNAVDGDLAKRLEAFKSVSATASSEA